MADGPNYDVAYRRRREGRTNYRKRLAMLKSGQFRAVIRISNAHAQVQLVAYDPKGDKTVLTASSQQLEQFGWEHNTGNIPAAYLTGYLAGLQAQEEGIEEAIPDFGVRDQQYASRYYATVRGLRDAGIEMNVEDRVFPSEDRLGGEHIASLHDIDMESEIASTKDAIESEYGGDN